MAFSAVFNLQFKFLKRSLYKLPICELRYNIYTEKALYFKDVMMKAAEKAFVNSSHIDDSFFDIEFLTINGVKALRYNFKFPEMSMPECVSIIILVLRNELYYFTLELSCGNNLALCLHGLFNYQIYTIFWRNDEEKILRTIKNVLIADDDPFEKKKEDFSNLNDCIDTDDEMLWYSFLAYFGIWIGALFSVNIGVMIKEGVQYFNRSFIYKTYPAVSVIDNLFVACFFFLAVVHIFTGIILLERNKIAPTMLTVNYSMCFAVNFLYPLVIYLICDVNVYELMVVAILYSILIIGNKIYFDKRADLFKLKNLDFHYF